MFYKDLFNQLDSHLGLLDKYTLGFEQPFQRLADFSRDNAKSLTSNWPPFNIKKVDENHYVLELACAGFGKSDLDITLNKGTLTISGKTSFDKEEGEFLYKGIAERAFTRSFSLADSVEVKGADLINGFLKVYLESLTAISSARKIEIGGRKEQPELLNESKKKVA